MLKIKHAEGRNEYIDLVQEANILWNKILSQKGKNRSKQPEGPSSFIKIIIQAKTGLLPKSRFFPNPINCTNLFLTNDPRPRSMRMCKTREKQKTK